MKNTSKETKSQASKQEYAVYHSDEFIAIGTLDELAKLEGVNKQTIQFYSYPIYLKRTNGKGKVVIKVWTNY